MKQLRNKSGQVTLYVLIGVSLLITLSLLFYYFSDTTIMSSNDKTMNDIEKNSLQIIVDSCLKRSVDESMEIIRLQGGYIQFPKGVKTLEVESNMTVKDGRIVKEKGLIKVPYYIYNNQLSIPTLELIKSQSESFILNRFVSCIDDFKDLKEEGYEVSQGSPKIKVLFDVNTIVDLNYSVNLTKGDLQISQKEFRFIAPINFKDMYLKALKLTMYEYLGGYLERHAKSLISLYSYNGDNNAESLPPFGLTMAGLNCNKKTWTKSEVKNNLMKIFNKNYPYLKIARLNYTKVITNDKISQGTYDSFIEDLLEEDLSTHLDISYNERWGIDNFDINPSAGGSIEPDEADFTGIPIISALCSLKYNFKYTFRNPILFTMWNSDNDKYMRSSSIPEEKYKYYFVMESYVCGNNAKICTGKSTYSKKINEIIKSVQNQTSICSDQNLKNYIINIVDQYGNPLKDASVDYYCGNEINNCFLGTSDGEGNVIAKIPYCENGIFQLSKKGYYDIQEISSIKDMTERRFKFIMSPEIELNYNVSIISIRDFVKAYLETSGFESKTCDGRAPEFVFNSLLNNLNNEDIVTISLKDPKTFFSPTMSINSFGKIPSRVVIPPGSYDLSLTYMGNVVIKPIFIDTGDGTKKEFSFNKEGHGSYKGTWMLGNMKIPYILDGSELVDKSFINFYMLSNILPSDDLNFSSVNRNYINEFGDIIMNVTINQNSLPEKNCKNARNRKKIVIHKEDYTKIIRPVLK